MSRCCVPQSDVSFVTVWLLLVCAFWADALCASEYQADSPSPEDGSRTVDPSNVRLAWAPARQAWQQWVFVGTSPLLTSTDQITSLPGTSASYFYSLGFELDRSYFWRIDTMDASGTLHTGETWTFTTLSYQASGPNPTPGSHWVASDHATLTWQAGLLAVSHELYFGEQKEAVELGLASVYEGLLVGTGQLQHAIGTLEKGTTYYWRVDERQSSGFVTRGDLWHFTTLMSDGGMQGRYFDNTYLGEDPVLTRVDKTVNLVFSQDNALRRVLTSDQFSVRWTGQLFAPTADGITLHVRANDCVRLTLDGQVVIEDWTPHPTRELSALWFKQEGTAAQIVLEYAHIQGNPHAQLLWSYNLQPPQIIPNGPLRPNTQSHLPRPAESERLINHSPRLSWQPGTTAVSHDLYLGLDPTRVAQAQPHDPELLNQPQGTSLDVTGLAANQTYYWRVDDVNVMNEPQITAGPVWQFSTAAYTVLDDFESYTNIPSERIFEAWVDGLGYAQPLPSQPGNNTGATVGHIGRPYAEQQRVHAGSQSMPMAYQNDRLYQLSEARHTFTPPLNMGTFSTLSLAFHGQPGSIGHFTKQQDTFTLTGAGTGLREADDRCYFVSQSVSGSASISARINSIGPGHPLAQAGIMIRQNNEPNAPQACIAITADGRLASHYRSSVGQPVTSLYSEPDAVTLPHWIKLQRQGAVVTLFHSQNGFTWAPVMLDNQSSMSLSGFGSLGLMHCVHKDNLSTGTAVFSQVFSSSVTPFNSTSSLGIPLNEADDLYLRLEDTQGAALIIPHPQNSQSVPPVQQTTWKTWRIDVSGLTGINLASIRTLSIGVGSPDHLKFGGTGLIFIDDIALHP
ncbi:MAG: hypothetical protein GY809_18695 [Planctomycetes bacterium]|nr:hypothetical protein [Planctomycetota bacterium]